MKFLIGSLLLLLLYPIPTKGQTGPQQGDHEMELWVGGGHSVNGGIGGISAWNLGLRYGWILTDLYGPSILRGQFEYAVDVVPAFLVFEPKGTAYGFVLDPIVLKWDFRERRRVVPYLEIGSGPLLTTRDVPPGISRWNFASSAATGLYFLTGRYGLSAELRLMHISDAGLTNPNPGLNTLQVRVGFSVFGHHR